MPNLLRRPVLAFALGAALAAAAAGGTAAYAALADERVAACYAPKTGALYVIGRDGAPAKCADGHVPIDWSIDGPQGPAGVFSGTFKSPNGAYAISVTDSGIVLSGPGLGRAPDRRERRDRERRRPTTVAQAGTSLALASGNGTTIQVGKDLAVATGGCDRARAPART